MSSWMQTHKQTSKPIFGPMLSALADALVAACLIGLQAKFGRLEMLLLHGVQLSYKMIASTYHQL